MHIESTGGQMFDIINLGPTLLLATGRRYFMANLSPAGTARIKAGPLCFFAEHSDGTRLEGDQLDRSA